VLGNRVGKQKIKERKHTSKISKKLKTGKDMKWKKWEGKWGEKKDRENKEMIVR
jgi:hypothetical protein